MKRFLVFIGSILWLITALYGQQQNRDAMNVSSIFGYPLSVGNATIGNNTWHANQLLPDNLELDNTPRLQIGEIPNQTVWHEGDITVGFYVAADTLHSNNVTYSYSIDHAPEGKITFDEATGRFKYFPDKFDVRDFTVTFTAQAGSKEISQDVRFNLMPAAPPEFSAFGVPDANTPASNEDYTVFSDTLRKDKSNNISISGKDLIFDSRIDNKLRVLTTQTWGNISELNLFAERVIIRDPLYFQKTNVTIYAKELIFEDRNGKISSISTSPAMFSNDPTSTETGANGANAGNITLYIKDFKQTSQQLRFIAIGGNGESSNGKPGKGGNGGVVKSTIDVHTFCDLIHGSGGRRNDWMEFGQHGTDGNFTLETKEFEWLHPNFVSAVVKHAKDAYLNLHNGFTYEIFKEYTVWFNEYRASNEWAVLSDEQKMELNNADMEMQTVMARIGQNLDYFGNPIGWVPMLSFEVNKLAFEQEIEKAIRVMYLSYWLKDIERFKNNHLTVCENAISMVRKELGDNEKIIKELVKLIPELRNEVRILEGEIQNVQQRIADKENQLLAQAKDNLKKRDRLAKCAGVLNVIAAVTSQIPCVGTVVSAAAAAGSAYLTNVANASQAEVDKYADVAGEFYNTAKEFTQSDGFSKVSEELDKIDISALNSSGTKEAFKNISETVTPVIKSIGKVYTAFSQSPVTNEQVKAELNKLIAESKEYQEFQCELTMLQDKKLATEQKIADAFNNIATTSIEVQNNIATIDGLNGDLFNGNSRRDLRAMQYLDDMERRAKERLLKYHYYMGKAYEYRMLQPYNAELNLTSLFERFRDIAKTNPNKSILDAADFQNLKAVYEEQLSTVTANILDEYNNNRPELTTPIRFKLTEEDLAALNAERDINLNIFERGMISPNQENVRIVSFKIYDMKVHLEGNQSNFAYFDLLLEHSGISRLRNKGEIYYFNHINNQNQNPITWGIRYDAISGINNTHEPSFASSSLLYSLLEKLQQANNQGQTNNIMIYSRPSAWADIRISKNNVVSGNTKMIIDELIFELQYDFVQRPTANRNLDIYAKDIDGSNITLSPYIEVSQADKSGRANGRAIMYRTYNSNTDVTLTAPKEYGRYQFVNWTDRYDAVVSTKLSVNTKLTNDVVLTANYKYMGAILKTTDTVYVSQNTGFTAVKVENIGSEEMEWTAVSNDSWLRITDGEEGVDNGYISLEYDNNPSETKRTGSLTITTDDGQSATVYVVQCRTTGIKENALPETKIYPNPANDRLYIENDGITEVLVTDALGCLMYHTIIVNSGSISVGDWNSGLYFVTLKTAKGSSVHKIVKR